MEFDRHGELKVNYSDRLVTLQREVRQLAGVGYAIPPKIKLMSETAQKFYRHAIILHQVRILLIQRKLNHLLISPFYLNLLQKNLYYFSEMLCYYPQIFFFFL